MFVAYRVVPRSLQKTMKKILIVEDEAIIRMALRKLLQRHGYDVREAGSVKEALSKHKVDAMDLIISDLRLPGELGTEMINAAKTPVLIMTSYASLRSAVDAMRMGAVDYIAKPFDHDEMVATVARICDENSQKSTAEPSTPSDNTMIGESPIMQALYKRIQQVAPTAATVLVNGETGTGKELTAKAIHNASQRAEQKLISINCAAIPENLIESELFGHIKGAFTGADSDREGLVVAADGGTLFLDEIGELPMEAQARLLRVLQEGEVRSVGSVDTRKVDVRLIAATHRDLGQRCKEGLFREDLYFRLNVIQLQIPPLRERGDDILKIARALIARYAESYQKAVPTLSDDAIEAIAQYRWPGNVRELENAIQRALILCDNGQPITQLLLALDLEAKPEPVMGLSEQGMLDMMNHISQKQQKPAPAPAKSDDNLSLEDYFQRFVLEHQDNMSETELAKQLGVSRKCLWERRQKFGIPRSKTANKK